MAPIHSKFKVSNGETATRYIVPIIGLERPEKTTLTKGEYVVLKCRTNPTEESSSTYDLPIPYYSTGTPEEWLRFERNLEKAFTGQNLTTGPQQYACLRRLLEGNALTVFDLKAAELGAQTVSHLQDILRALRREVFPEDALQQQKRYMRRSLHKPRNMTIRVYVNRVLELNDQLENFPGLNSNDNGTKLPEDEVLDLLEFGLPETWQNFMLLQKFDPQVHTINDFVQFCERLETLEKEEKRKRDSNPKKKSSRLNKEPTKEKKSSGKRQGLNCLVHGENCGHTSDQCFVLKKQAKRLKLSTRSSNNSNNRYGTNYAELNVMIANAVKKAVKSLNKKRKLNPNKDLQAFEELSISDSEASASSHDSDNSE